MVRFSSSIFACVLVCLAMPALAAAKNPAVEACEGKHEGDACGLMKMVKPPGGGELQRKTVPGACRSDECCDLDYSKGSPPETVCHTCLACKDGPADGTPPVRADDPKAPAKGEPPRTEQGGPPPTGPSEQRGCSVSGVGGGTGLAGWLTGILLLVAPRRRQPQ